MKSDIQFGSEPQPDVILLVEEDRALNDLIKMALHRRGFQVEAVNRSDQVADRCDRFNPMIILLDLFLPGTNGLALLKELKASGKLNGRHVILISAYGFMEVIEQAVLLGVEDFVVKPVDIDLLVQKVLKWSETN